MHRTLIVITKSPQFSSVFDLFVYDMLTIANPVRSSIDESTTCRSTNVRTTQSHSQTDNTQEHNTHARHLCEWTQSLTYYNCECARACLLRNRWRRTEKNSLSYTKTQICFRRNIFHQTILVEKAHT